MKYRRLKFWQIALISVVLSAIGGLSSRKSSKKERRLYDRDLKQAPWAPPGWVFGPAWTINNFFLLMALQRILSSDIPEKKKLLAFQTFIWIIFFSFGYVYFNKKSPLLAAGWTIADAILALLSFKIVSKNDKKLALYYLPLMAWTGFASTIAAYQALKNPDPVFNSDPVMS